MTSKVDKSKLKICQYGENCYRKNPIHFGEFSHPHLDKIYEQGKDPSTNEYIIPDEFFMSAEVIEIQLKLLEKLFPKPKAEESKNTQESNKRSHKTVVDGNSVQGGYQLGSSKVAANTSTAEIGVKSKVPQNVAGSSRTTTDNSNLGKAEESKNTQESNKRSHKTVVDGNSVQSGYQLGSSKAAENTSTAETSVKSKVPQNVAGSSRATTDNSNLAKKQKLNRDIKDYIPVVLERGKMADKLKKAAPYNMFLTAITASKPTHNESLTVTLQEIFDESLGEIESTVQINFMVDIAWLLGHYYFAGILDKPLLVLYGDDMPELKEISKNKPQVTAIKINMPTPFATSHTKMMLIGYKDGSMRVVISTANLYEDDWHNRTQGVWISPQLKPMNDSADTVEGESPTNFRSDLVQYLTEYKCVKLQPWIARIRKTNFSEINVFLIASAPVGDREGPRGYSYGHARLGGLLQKHSAPIDEKIPVVCQSSSIGSLGPNIQAWIQHDFINSLRKDSQPLGVRKLPPFKMIYPSFSNVSNSHDGMLGGGCLPYGKNTNDKQPWLKSYLHQWSSSVRYRSHAMPHIKSYTRFNLEQQCVYWFVLTSANLSKAAWGAFNKNVKLQPCLRIANYEAGVLFLPKFVTGETTFPLGYTRDKVPPFPLPYDVPLTAYGPDDTPFLMDYLR